MMTGEVSANSLERPRKRLPKDAPGLLATLVEKQLIFGRNRL